MKRLTLEAFHAKKTTLKQGLKVSQLLGQVLGNCHDDHGDQSIQKKSRGY